MLTELLQRLVIININKTNNQTIFWRLFDWNADRFVHFESDFVSFIVAKPKERSKQTFFVRFLKVVLVF